MITNSKVSKTNLCLMCRIDIPHQSLQSRILALQIPSIMQHSSLDDLCSINKRIISIIHRSTSTPRRTRTRRISMRRICCATIRVQTRRCRGPRREFRWRGLGRVAPMTVTAATKCSGSIDPCRRLQTSPLRFPFRALGPIVIRTILNIPILPLRITMLMFL